MAKKRWVDGKLRIYSRWWVVFNARWKHLRSKEENIEWFWRTNPSKVHASLEFLERYCGANNFKNIISFGSGLCTVEYLLWRYLSKVSKTKISMLASDVDVRVVKVANRLFPELECIKFDFYWSSVKLNIGFKYGNDFDFAFMIDSTYSMDDDTFVTFFRQLKELGVNDVVDFCGGIVTHKRYIGKYLYQLYNGFNYILKGKLQNPESYIPVGPHGYGRTRKDLIKLYNKAGYDVVYEPDIDGIKFVAVLKVKK